MAGDTSTILLTSADIQNIQNEQTRITAEIAALEGKLPVLRGRSAELDQRLEKINSLLTALGLGDARSSATSAYGSRYADIASKNGAAH